LPVQVLRLFAKESVNRVEHLPSILFHEDRMDALADFDPPAVPRRPELAENGQRHIDWTIPIPLGVDDQNRRGQATGVIQRLPRGPILTTILDRAVRCPQLVGADARLRKRCCGPGFEPGSGQNLLLLVVGNAIQPTGLCRRSLDDAVGSERAAGIGSAWCRPDLQDDRPYSTQPNLRLRILIRSYFRPEWDSRMPFSLVSMERVGLEKRQIGKL
jgi:hypothetical protein